MKGLRYLKGLINLQDIRNQDQLERGKIREIRKEGKRKKEKLGEKT